MATSFDEILPKAGAPMSRDQDVPPPQPSKAHSKPLLRGLWLLMNIAVFYAVATEILKIGGYYSSPSLSTNYEDGYREQDLVDDDGTLIASGPGSGPFEGIEPNVKLNWKPCIGNLPGSFFCAKLRVPMDYKRPLDERGVNPHVDLALLMIPGDRDGDSTPSETPLLLNFGGPGGPGVDSLAGFSHILHSIVGNKYDLVAFDPRGIGYTKPSADCYAYPSDGSDGPSDDDKREGDFHRLLWLVQDTQIGLVNASDRALATIDARHRAVAKACAVEDNNLGQDSILRHINTPNVARDMISIVDTWKEWRDSVISTNIEKQEKETSNNSESAVGKLVYWGFSYGTLLGATAAAMFPERVHRVILDGVVDADHYVAPVWSKSIQDADHVVEQFAKYCVEAGNHCAFYQKGDTKSALSNRFQAILDDLKESPIYGYDYYSHTPAVLEYSTIKSIIFSTLYSPIQSFSTLAYLLHSVYVAQHYNELPPGFGDVTGIDLDYVCSSSSTIQSTIPKEAQRAIMCADKRYPLNDTLPALQERFEKLSKTSSFADVWMTLMDACSHWPIPQYDHMDWDAHPITKPDPIKTNFPLLFLSNTYDPVTPLQAGHLMAKKFVDAGLVELKTEGHCTLSAASSCILGKIREYLNDGKVPSAPGSWDKKEWETCKADETPWTPYMPDRTLQMYSTLVFTLGYSSNYFERLDDVYEPSASSVFTGVARISPIFEEISNQDARSPYDGWLQKEESMIEDKAKWEAAGLCGKYILTDKDMFRKDFLARRARKEAWDNGESIAQGSFEFMGLHYNVHTKIMDLEFEFEWKDLKVLDRELFALRAQGVKAICDAWQTPDPISDLDIKQAMRAWKTLQAYMHKKGYFGYGARVSDKSIDMERLANIAEKYTDIRANPEHYED